MTIQNEKFERMTHHKKKRSLWVDVIAVVTAVVVFLVPLAFIFLQASKTQQEAFFLNYSLPTHWNLFKNFHDLFVSNNGLLKIATINTLLVTFFSVTILVLISGMAGYVIARKKTRTTKVANFSVLSALIVPPAIVPTIWILQKMHIFRTIEGLILVEVTYGMAFAILLFRNFMSSIPRELDEAAIVDGCSGWRLYFKVIFPLLRPVTITIIIISTVAIFNDFTNPLYFLPGRSGATLQLTLYNFKGQFFSQWNLLFTDILYITIFPLIAFAFFNRKIVEGMTAGSVKG